ncbi:MAG TPA: hypothetical protein VMW48_18445, partial [Vicinamibacterales bacterium]|nr:hypothetical protein [Vicinamibacterales bacterium]
GQPSLGGDTNRPPDADSTDGPSIAGYQITQSDAQPTEWLDAPPNEFTFAAPAADGPVTLYAWVRDSAKPPAVSKLAATITFTRAAPTAIAKDARIATIPPDQPAVMTSSDIDDGSSDPAGMEISTSIACDGDQTPAEPYLTLSKPGDYHAVLTVTNAAGTASRAECTIHVSKPWATADDLAWTGGAGPGKPEWSNPANWARRLVPDDPAGVLTFADDGAGTVGTVTNAVEPPAGSWTVTGLTVANTLRQHFTDLRGNRLIVDGTVTTGDMLVGQPVTIANGTLQVGTAERPGNIVVGYGTNYRHHVPRGLLKLSNVVLDARLDRLDVGVAMTWWFVTTSVLDLQEAAIADGRLAADTLRVGYRGVGYLQIGPESGLRELVIARDLMIGSNGKGAFGRLGDPHNGYRLPPGVCVRVGSPEVRGRLHVAEASPTYATEPQDGYFAASDGGRFDAWLTELRVGCNAKVSGLTSGVVDLRRMDACMISTNYLGVGVAVPDKPVDGSVYLPPGAVRAGAIAVGCANAAGTGLLQLNDTACSAESVSVGRTGMIEINVTGASTGLVLGEAGTLEIADGGRILIDVSHPLDPSTQANVVGERVSTEARSFRWAVQWRGDHVDYLNERARAGRIVWPAAPPLTIFLRDGCTYVGLLGNPPRITEFQLVDQTSGGCTVTSGDAVRVRASAVPGDSPIAGWALTSEPKPPDDPARWTDRPPAAVALDGPPGEFVRYAWVKD